MTDTAQTHQPTEPPATPMSTLVTQPAPVSIDGLAPAVPAHGGNTDTHLGMLPTHPQPAPPRPASSIKNNGRDKIPWSHEIWDMLDKAVHDECARTRVAAKYLPIHNVADHTTTVPADSVTPPGAGNTVDAFDVDEGAVNRLIEFWDEFSLTPQQVEQESQLANSHRGHSTAVTLATQAANRLTRAQDLIIFQGATAFSDPMFTGDPTADPPVPPSVISRGRPADFGLLNIVPDGSTVTPLPDKQIIQVFPVSETSPDVYAEHTFTAVAQGYGVLQEKGQYGPYALTLHTVPYADTYAPLANTLIMTADRIKPLMTAGFFGSGTLPSNPNNTTGLPRYTGSLVSIGGNTMDLVVGIDACVSFTQDDVNGAKRFRVLERLALRLKLLDAVIRLEFM